MTVVPGRPLSDTGLRGTCDTYLCSNWLWRTQQMTGTGENTLLRLPVCSRQDEDQLSAAVPTSASTNDSMGKWNDRNSAGGVACRGEEQPGLDDILTWPPWSCWDLGALYWVCTNRQPFGSLGNSSEQFCCTLEASRWSLWKVPTGTAGQDTITSIPSYLHWICWIHGVVRRSRYLLLHCSLSIWWRPAIRVMHNHHVWLTFK